jgi:hypothetical protein
VNTSAALRALNTEGILITNIFTEVGLGYKVSNRFYVESIFRLSDRIEDDLRYHPRYMGILDLKINYPFRSFQFDYRGRFQNITRSYINSENDMKQTAHLRNRLSLSYNIPDTRTAPGVYIETFTPLNGYNPEFIDELRCAADLRIRIKDNQSFTPRILYIYEQFETNLSGLIFQLIYGFSIG